MPYYPYRSVGHDHSIAFTSSGLRQLENAHLLAAFNRSGSSLNLTEEEWLKFMTGCQTFLEFRERIFSPHKMIDHELSLLLIERVQIGASGKGLKFLTFRALLMNSSGQWVALVRRRLNRSEAVVDHNLLCVHPNFEGQGVASVVAQSHEDAWEAAGYRAVALTAGELPPGIEMFGENRYAYSGSNVGIDGRVFWAKQGFDFHRIKGVRSSDYIRQGIVAELSRAAMAGLVEQDFANELIDNINEIPAYELVNLKDDQGGELGVKSFRFHDWQGYKELNDTWPGNSVALGVRKRHLLLHPFPR